MNEKKEIKKKVKKKNQRTFADVSSAELEGNAKEKLDLLKVSSLSYKLR